MFLFQQSVSFPSKDVPNLVLNDSRPISEEEAIAHMDTIIKKSNAETILLVDSINSKKLSRKYEEIWLRSFPNVNFFTLTSPVLKRRGGRKQDKSDGLVYFEEKIAFDDFFCLLASTLSNRALLVSKDVYKDLIPSNPRIGKTTYTKLMSSAYCTPDNAKQLNEVKTQIKDYVESPTFKKRIMDQLMWALKGLTTDWNDDSAHSILQAHDGVFYIPYATKRDDFDVTKWAVFTPE